MLFFQCTYTELTGIILVLNGVYNFREKTDLEVLLSMDTIKVIS